MFTGALAEIGVIVVLTGQSYSFPRRNGALGEIAMPGFCTTTAELVAWLSARAV